MVEGNPANGEAFSAWWSEAKGIFAKDSPEAQAKAAWNAATLAAATIVNNEVDLRVKCAEYESAAITRDCRERIEQNFTLPSMWCSTFYPNEYSRTKGLMDPYDIQRYQQFLGNLTITQLLEWRAFAIRTGSSERIALETVLADRNFSSQSESGD